MSFSSYINLKFSKWISIPSPVENVENVIGRFKEKKFTVEEKNERSYEFSAYFQLGVLTGGFGKQMKVVIRGKLDPEPDGDTSIHFTAKAKTEVIGIIVIWIIMLAAPFFGGQNSPLWLSFAIFPPALIWLFIVYRIHEQKLLEMVKKALQAKLSMELKEQSRRPHQG